MGPQFVKWTATGAKSILPHRPFDCNASNLNVTRISISGEIDAAGRFPISTITDNALYPE